jgi:hypothetical protein
MLRRLIGLALPFLAAFAALAPAQPAPKETDNTFRVSATARLTMEIQGKKQQIDADTGFIYTWKRADKSRTLVVNSAQVRTVTDGREMMDAKLSRAGLFGTNAGRKTDVKLENAPEPLRKLLTDSFGGPICTIEVDKTGKEVNRTIVAGPGAASLIDGGMIANCTMFHPWYSADQNEWQAEMRVSTGNDLASGQVTYTKVAGGKGGQAVRVMGTLSADGVKGPNGTTVKDGKYEVSGEQTYDPVSREWVAGKLKLDISFAITQGPRMIGTAKGTMDVIFERLKK